MSGAPAARPSRIVVLQHERERPLGSVPYRMRALVAHWREAGHHVVVQRGVSMRPAADLAIAHLDLTVLPAAYRDWLAAYPCALNGNAHDLSKRVVSRALVVDGDGYKGPVVVKTDRNYGGLPEERLSGGRRATRGWRRLFHRRPSLARARWLDPLRYPLFDRVAELPPGVFENPALVVERFVPEREGERYALRTWTFLGEAGRATRFLSDEPIVKPALDSPKEACEVPAEVRAARQRLGLDYGKIDWVVHAGAVFVLDATRTPGLRPGALPPVQIALHRELAVGLMGLP